MASVTPGSVREGFEEQAPSEKERRAAARTRPVFTGAIIGPASPSDVISVAAACRLRRLREEILP
jgi:hypothetical protein